MILKEIAILDNIIDNNKRNINEIYDFVNFKFLHIFSPDSGINEIS